MFREIYYGIVNFIAGFIYKKRKVVFSDGSSNPSEPAIFIANHSGILGPVVMQKYLKVPKKVWVTSGMTSKANSTNYFFHDMLVGRSSENKKKTRKTAKLIVNLVQPLIKKNKRFIVVNKSSKALLNTFKESLNTLISGKSLVIFPEKHLRYGKYVHSFHQGFVDIARLYYNKTGKNISFYPVYIGNKLKTINVGEPVKFDEKLKRKEAGEKISLELQDRIEKLGASLPEHEVIPYVPQSFYEFYPEYEDDEIGFFNFANQPYSE